MDAFRLRRADVKQADDARNALIDDLLREVNNLQKIMDRNAFVLVLIDGDSLQFLNSLVRRGMPGGDEAVMRLRKAVFEYLKDDPIFKHDNKIVIRVYANLRGLSNAYANKGILPNATAYNDFVLGFNKAHPLCDFTDAGNHKEAADSKLKELLNLYISNVHCKQIIFGGPTDNAYASFINSYHDIDAPARIRLLKGPPFATEFQRIIHKFTCTEFETVFRKDLLHNDDMIQQNNNLVKVPLASHKSATNKNNYNTLIPWNLRDDDRNPRIVRSNASTSSESLVPSSNNGRAYDTAIRTTARTLQQSSNAGSPDNDLPGDADIVEALVVATRTYLDQAPKGLDFGTVKAHVERRYNLPADFWGFSEHDKWFSRSKKIIKWAVEDWVERTDNSPPGNATWMLRHFSGTESPASVLRSAAWRTSPDKDMSLAEPVLSDAMPPSGPRADSVSGFSIYDPVPRNAAGQRLDLPMGFRLGQEVIDSVRKRNPRLCNMYYLAHACSNPNCEFDHESRLSSTEATALLYLSRSQPCSRGTTCDIPACLKGHVCPNGIRCSYGKSCRLASTHGMDTTPV